MIINLIKSTIKRLPLRHKVAKKLKVMNSNKLNLAKTGSKADCMHSKHTKTFVAKLLCLLAFMYGNP